MHRHQDEAHSQQIVVVQPALPHYRLDFFDRLSDHYGNRFKVFFSPTDLGLISNHIAYPEWARELPLIRGPLAGLYWQPGLAAISFKKGDILILSGNPRLLSTLVLLYKAKAVGAKVIWWGHHWSSTSQRWRYWLRRLPMKAADLLLFYTDQEISDYQSHGGDTSKPLTAALNNGINTDTIRTLRQSYRPEDREHALLFIGRLTEKSELGLALQAIHEMGESAPHLHIIGEGDTEQKLRHQATQLNVSHKLSWHGGRTDEAAIANIANRCKAFLYPGGVGLSLIHAMAYGLPCIIHDDPRNHMPESHAFFSAKAGLPFSRGDVHSLASAVLRLIGDNESLKSCSAKAVAITSKDFNTQSMCSRLISAIDMV